MYMLKIHKVGHCAMIWLGAAKNPLDDPLLLWTERPLKSSEPLEANKLTRQSPKRKVGRVYSTPPNNIAHFYHHNKTTAAFSFAFC